MPRHMIVVAAVTVALSASGTAFAKGHVVGALAGAALAGKHHRVAGAVVGGAVGHHMAKKHDAKKQIQATPG